MTISDQKKNLRRKMLSRRAELLEPTKKQYDEWICQELRRKIDGNQFSRIHCFLPMGSEIDIIPLIKTLLEKRITVVCPKTLAKRSLKHLVLHSLSDLKKGVYGTVYPSGEKEFKGDFDLIIVPGLSFDPNNYRLGYGGGYYDEFLKNHPSAQKIGIFYPFQEVEKVPIESHDVRLDEILVGTW